MGLWKSNAGSNATPESLLRLIEGKNNVAELEESLQRITGRNTYAICQGSQ